MKEDIKMVKDPISGEDYFVDQEGTTVSYADYEEYYHCKNDGRHNMYDYANWQIHTFLTKEQWFMIIKNYNEISGFYGF